MSAAFAEYAVITSKCFVVNSVKYTQIVSHFPSFSLVQPHKRCVDNKIVIHSKIDCNIIIVSVGMMIVIVGGGIVGNATAYYLCRKGLKPLVLERKVIGHGGSSRNAGGVRQSARDVRELPLAMYAVQNIWPNLSEELGVDIEYEQKGNLRLGKTPEHIEKLTKLTASCNKMGLDMVMLDSAQAHEINPYMSDEVIGAAWCPSDGQESDICPGGRSGRRKRGTGGDR